MERLSKKEKRLMDMDNSVVIAGERENKEAKCDGKNTMKITLIKTMKLELYCIFLPWKKCLPTHWTLVLPLPGCGIATEMVVQAEITLPSHPCIRCGHRTDFHQWNVRKTEVCHFSQSC